jgi:hypothetical protein
MVGVPSVRRARGAGLFLALLLGIAPGTAAAGTSEPVLLAEQVLASTVADLDRNGEREVIAVRNHPDDARRLVVEAWGMIGDEWRSLGSTTLQRWDAEASAPEPAMFGSEGVGLLSVRDGPRTRVLVATASGPPGEQGATCCLSISELGVADARVTLDLMPQAFGTAESLQVTDLDGDGSDELLAATTEPSSDDGFPSMRYALLRQVEDGFTREELALDGDGHLFLSMVGDTDGVPGDDLILADETGNRLVRVVEHEGRLLIEAASTDAFSPRGMQGWAAAAANGLIGWVEDRGMTTVSWPRGKQPDVVALLELSDFPSIFLLGTGPAARWVEFAGLALGAEADEIAIRVYDTDLQLEQTIEVPSLTRQLMEVNSRGPLSATAPERYLYEQVGPVPGGLGPDRPAILGYGNLIELEPDGSVRVTATAQLAGVGITGAAGADDGWLAVAGEWWGSGAFAYLGNVGYAPAYGMLGVIPLTAVLERSGDTAPVVELSGATVIGSGTDARLFTSGDPFELTVAAEPGDLVVAYDELRSVAEEVTGDSVTLTIRPPGRDDRNQEFELSVFVIGPTGLISGTSWHAQALRVAPEVTAAAAIEAFALRATISGEVTPGVTVTVDGASVVPTPSGAFRVDVDAPAWPRDVLVVARDALGKETVERLEIIGFVDYRGLPWIPIVGTLTVVAGLVLFVRTPRLRPEARLRPDGDGRLEEVDGDLI